MGKVDSLSPTLERQVFRPRVIEEIARHYRTGTRVVAIEAQAGQGKTTAALQFLAHFDIDAIWYALSPSDHDPMVFVAGLYAACVHGLPGLRLPLLEALLDAGTIAPADHARVADMLVRALQGNGRSERYLVIDDVHEIEGHGASADILGRLASIDGPGLPLLLLSRRPILPTPEMADGSVPVARLNNDTLAFTTTETAELYGSAFNVSVGRRELRRLTRLTEGWGMGLTLLASSLAEDGRIDTIPDEPLALLRDGQIPDYFRAQLLDRVPEAQRHGLLALSLLDSIPEPLARRLAPELDLAHLSRHNLFLRRLEGEADRYAFHHLFRESLRRLAEAELPGDRQAALLGESARWHDEDGDIETALRYLLRARAHAEADALAGRGGLELLARNRIVTVHELLHELSEAVLVEHPWLAYLYALSLMNTDPPAAYRYLEQARVRFGAREDGVGELLASAQLMFFHITVDTHYQEIPSLLERARTLYQRHGESLSAPMRVQCAQYIAFSHIHTERDREKGCEHSAHALRLAQRHGLDNAIANVAIGRAYEGMFRGDWARVARDVEYAYPYQDSPRTTAFTRLLLHFVQANFLSHLGDGVNYRHKRMRAEQTLSANLFSRTLCQPFLASYDADLAMAEGRVDDAATILDAALEGEHAAVAPHMRSQLLQCRACVAALRGDRDAVEQDASEALRLRAEAGHPYHIYKNHLLVAQAYALLGDRAQAEPHLAAVLDYAERHGVSSMRPLAWFLRAKLHLDADETTAGQAALARALGDMRDSGHRYLFGWQPGLMRRLLSAAVRHEIETDHARQLAVERLDCAILDDGMTIPLLTVQTLGGLTLSAPGHGALHAGDFTPIQRELVGLLVAAPGGSVSHGEIQLALWPDASPDKVRARLDTTVARLRKRLSSGFGELAINHYLPLENKQLRLANCRVDVREFTERARAGLAHLRRREYWQAGNALRAAHAWWRGEFLPGTTVPTRFRDELESLYNASIVGWIEALDVGGEIEEAVHIADEAVRRHPCDETLVRCLYDLQTRIGDAVGARRTIRAYEAALRDDGHSADEVTEAIEWFWEEAETAAVPRQVHPPPPVQSVTGTRGQVLPFAVVERSRRRVRANRKT